MTYLGNHWNESLTLARGETNEHTRSEVPIKVSCKSTQDSTNEHDGGCNEQHDTTADCYGYRHPDQVANAPAYYEPKYTEGQGHYSHGQCRVCHKRGNVGIILTSSRVTRNVEAQ